MLLAGGTKLGQADAVKDRAEAAHKVFDQDLALWKAGRATIEDVCTWSVRWMDADSSADALAAHAKRLDDIAAEAKKRVSAGAASPVENDIAAYYVADAAARKAGKKK